MNLDRRLERCELLTPIGTPAAAALMRASGQRDHVGEHLDDGTDVLVTPIVLPVRVSTVPVPRSGLPELRRGEGEQ